MLPLYRSMFSDETIDRFHRFYAKTDGCWEWIYVTKDGYGNFRHTVNRKRLHLRAHRVSYAIYFGHTPADRLVCHECDNPPCVNPAHLFLGTTLDNIRDMVTKGRHAATRDADARTARLMAYAAAHPHPNKLPQSKVDAVTALLPDLVAGRLTQAVAARTTLVSERSIQRIVAKAKAEAAVLERR